MYPFGSGMPQPQSNSPHGNNSTNKPADIPFNSGWAQAPAAPYPTSQYPTPQYPTSQYPTPQYPTPQYPMPQCSTPQYPTPVSGYAQQNSHHCGPPLNMPFSIATHPYNPNPAQYPSSTSTASSFANFQKPYETSPHAPHPSHNSPHGFQPIWQAGNSGMFPSQSVMHEQQNPVRCFQKGEGTPTVFAVQNFDPVKDAHDLRKAMKGFGTDEDALINIICRRSNEQRQEIQRHYKTNFGKDLIEDIKSETSGNFEKLLVGLLRPIVDFYCSEIKDAMAGIGTDEEVLIEILCTLSNAEIHVIKNQYLRLYGAHLESELISETSGNFKRLLVSLCTANRDESGQVDPVKAQNDVRELLKAGELRVGTDESMFNMILCQRNYQQLKLIFQEYQKWTGHSLEKAIKKEFSGDIMEGLTAIYKCVTNKSEYFASRLHKSMAGIGTNDKQLIRVIITRSEIDLGDIKATYERMYSKSLKSWIKGDTSGHYKHALYALIGEQRSS